MIIIRSMHLTNFEFWGGARWLADRLTSKEFDIIEQSLDEIQPYGYDETELNDIFWFDTDLIASFLGYENGEELEEVLENRK